MMTNCEWWKRRRIKNSSRFLAPNSLDRCSHLPEVGKAGRKQAGDRTLEVYNANPTKWAVQFVDPEL